MSSGLAALGQKSLSQLLKIFKDLPCLWDPHHEYYTNQIERKKAYGIILKKLNIDSNEVSVTTIKKKLENMRTTYKREYKKVVAATAKGERYRPTLWYYDLMSFIDCSDENSVDYENSIDHDYDNTVGYEYGYQDDEEEETKRKRPKLEDMSEIYLQDTDVYRQDSQVATTSVNPSDEAFSFGQTLGLQLRNIDEYQRTIAEKLISDTIFYARLNKLNTNSKIELNSE